MCSHILFLTIENTRAYFNQRSLAFIVLITGIVGGLLIVFSVLLLCKYCLNRKNLREAEQIKLLYKTLHQASLLDSNRLYQCGNREFSRLEPRRSNPLNRYQLPENERYIPSSKSVSSDYHAPGVQGVYNQSYHENREHTGNTQHDSHLYENVSNDDEPTQQYLQVDPRCYVRQKSNASVTTYRKSETPRLEKGHSINVDTRPSSTSSPSPYRQSSFDVTLACHSQNQQPSTPSSSISTQQEIYFTPRGSNLSVVGNTSLNTPPGSQHLSPPTPIRSRQNSTIEKKDVTVKLDMSGRTSTTRSSIVQREHEHSRSLEHSSSLNNSATDKQFRSFDTAHILQSVIHPEDAGGNHRTKSYEYAEGYHPPSPIAPAPIIIKIPDMRKLVQAVQLSKLQNKELDGYQQDSNRKSTLTHQIILNNSNNEGINSQDLWGLHQSLEFEEQQQQQLDRTSPEDFSPDLLTSTSIDSAGAMAIHQGLKITNNGDIDDDPSKYAYRRKSSSNLLLPPPEVRRQALRRTYEKRRSYLNQSNSRQEQQSINNRPGLDDENNNNQLSIIKSTEFLSLLNNFNIKSENSSFDRSLETDFDMQSETSSRGQNDHFTSIESSVNENTLPDVNHRLLINQKQQLSHQDDSGYKSLESQNSQNQTISLDWMSADGAETVIYMGEPYRQQQRSVDIKDLQEDLDEQQLLNNHRLNTKFNKSYQEPSTTLNRSILSNSKMIEQRNLSSKINLLNNKFVTSSSFNRTASKKRREFGKDKRHAASNIGLPHLITTDEYQFSSSINEQTSSPTLPNRHFDLRPSKPSEAEVLDSFTKKLTSHSNKFIKTTTHLSSSVDAILHSTPLPSPVRLNNAQDSRHDFQRSPSSITPPIALSPQIATFRSKRGSISFDNPILPINSPKTSTIYSANVTKPRLKFSMVRDTTTTSLGSASSSYSMPLANHFSIDAKTNRIINEFLMQDNNNNMNNDIVNQESPKHHHHQQIRQKTFDETLLINKNNVQKQSRTALIKQRQHSFVQTNLRQQTPSSYPSLHLADSNEQNKVKNNSSILAQQSGPVVRRDNGIKVDSPSIIVTGYDTGS